MGTYKVNDKKVSILTRSKERVLRTTAHSKDEHKDVSILTRSKERVLRYDIDTGVVEIKFQSSPAPKSGCYGASMIMPSSSELFQSSPAPKSGCYAFCVR